MATIDCKLYSIVLTEEQRKRLIYALTDNLISVKQYIKKVEGMEKDPNGKWHETLKKDYEDAKELCELASGAKVLDIAEMVEKMYDWTNVEDELPEIPEGKRYGEDVLAVDFYGNKGVAYRVKYSDLVTWGSNNDNLDLGHIVAWRPIPKYQQQKA